MPATGKSAQARPRTRREIQLEVRSALAWLEKHGSVRNREGMARYAITAPKVFGVPMGKIQALARRLGKDHALAAALWETGWYEARLLTAFVAEPGRLTSAEMDRWCRDFDNWAVCDTLCFHLFDRSPLAFRKVSQWAGRRPEFVRRAAFALLASLALHDKKTPDAAFVRCLPLIETAAEDERNFVKKAVSWALRGVGKRSPHLKASATAVARRLAESKRPAPRWVGKDALRELTRTAQRRRE